MGAVVALVGLGILAACGGGSAPEGGADGAPRNDDGGGEGNGPAPGGGAPAVPFGEVHDGIATYYDATGAGNCMFDVTPDDLDVAAMNEAEYDGSAVCGGCALVKGVRGEVLVRIVDRCPECERGHLDLSREAFAKVADPVDGRVPITWKMASCPVQGNVSYLYKEGSSQYWTAIQVRNHRLPIAKLAIEKGGRFVDVGRESYNYFVDADGAGPGPVRVRITAIDGQTLEDTLPPAGSEVAAEGSGQFR